MWALVALLEIIPVVELYPKFMLSCLVEGLFNAALVGCPLPYDGVDEPCFHELSDLILWDPMPVNELIETD